MFAHGERVDFLEAGEREDPYSETAVKDDWENPVTVLTAAAAVEPLASDEPLQDGRQAVIVGYRLYLPGNVSVDPSWRVSVRGELLSVDGKPAVWQSPFTGWAPGTVVQVGRTDG
jgi:hypothetical protein